MLLLAPADHVLQQVLEDGAARGIDRGVFGNGRGVDLHRLVRGDQRDPGPIDRNHGCYLPISSAERPICFTVSIVVTPASYAREAVIMLTISSTALTFGYST